MRVLLTFLPVIDSEFTRGMDVLPPTAIYLLGALLDAQNYDRILVDPVWYIDHQFFQSRVLPDDFLAEVDVVAISANSFNWGNTKVLIEVIHQMNPHIPIILGGVHPTYFDEYILKTTPASYIVRDEGEKTFLELLQIIENDSSSISGLPGITYKTPDGVVVRNPDRFMLSEEEYRLIPLPLLHEVPEKRYSAPPFESSRGCLFNCTFCGILHHRSWRALTADDSIARFCKTLEMAKNKFSHDYVFITDDCFSVNRERTIQIFDNLSRVAPETKVVLEGRITDLHSTELIASIPVKQIHRFLVGIESGYNEGLKKLNKGLTVEKIEEVLAKFRASNSASCLWCSFMIGLPWETEEDCMKTVRFAAKIVEDYGVQCSITWYSLIPSKIWNQRAEYGITIDESFYDLPNWFLPPRDPLGNKENFFKSHPMLTEESYQRVEELIFLYESMGIKLIDS